MRVRMCMVMRANLSVDANQCECALDRARASARAYTSPAVHPVQPSSRPDGTARSILFPCLCHAGGGLCAASAERTYLLLAVPLEHAVGRVASGTHPARAPQEVPQEGVPAGSSCAPLAHCSSQHCSLPCRPALLPHPPHSLLTPPSLCHPPSRSLVLSYPP
eukprot:6190377-Pleurochrysis_carterae.AAC.1